MSSSPTNRSRRLRLLKPVLGLVLLGVVARQLDVTELRRLAEHGDPWWLAVSLSCFLAALCGFQALRLHLLVARYTGRLANSMRLFFIGAFFNNLLPSNVGGDAVRLLYLRPLAGGRWAGPLSMLVLHRASGLLMILALFVIYAVLEGPRLWGLLAGAQIAWISPPPWLWAAGGGLAVALAWLLIRFRHRPLLRRVASRFTEFLASARTALAELSGRTLGLLLVLTGLFHAARLLGFYCAVRYFGERVAVWDLIPVLAVTAGLALLPITVGGLGVVEGAIGFGLSLFGVSPSVAVATALVQRLAMVVIALFGGLLYAADRDRASPQPPTSPGPRAASAAPRPSQRAR